MALASDVVVEPYARFEIGLFASAEYLARRDMPETEADLRAMREPG